MAEQTTNTLERIRRLLVEHLGCEPAAVHPGALLADDLGADSLDVIELVMAFEDAFGIEVADPEVPDAAETTVQTLVELVDRKLREGVDG
jgi:acyl carrier protein